MKVLFLDVDGVLNSLNFFTSGRRVKSHDYDPRNQIDPEAVKLLTEIIDATGAKIVISSVWRYNHRPGEMQVLLEEFGCRCQVIGSTPRSTESHARGKEIDAWLTTSGYARRDPVERFAILDDDADMEPHMKKLVKTSNHCGLERSHVERVIELLGRRE
jgi:hypothetical protein